MRFLRHLAAVCLVAAAVAGLGLAWDHFGFGTLASGRIPPGTRLSETAGSPPPEHAVLPKGARPGAVGIQPGSFELGLSSMFQPENLPYLRHTVVIEAGVIAAVVIVDAGRRRSRRASRPAHLDPPPPSDDPEGHL